MMSMTRIASSSRREMDEPVTTKKERKKEIRKERKRKRRKRKKGFSQEEGKEEENVLHLLILHRSKGGIRGRKSSKWWTGSENGNPNVERGFSELFVTPVSFFSSFPRVLFFCIKRANISRIYLILSERRSEERSVKKVACITNGGKQKSRKETRNDRVERVL